MSYNPHLRRLLDSFRSDHPLPPASLDPSEMASSSAIASAERIPSPLVSEYSPKHPSQDPMPPDALLLPQAGRVCPGSSANESESFVASLSAFACLPQRRTSPLLCPLVSSNPSIGGTAFSLAAVTEDGHPLPNAKESAGAVEGANASPTPENCEPFSSSEGAAAAQNPDEFQPSSQEVASILLQGARGGTVTLSFETLLHLVQVRCSE